MRASAAIAKLKLLGLAVCCTKHQRQQSSKLIQDTEVFMRNVVLVVVKKILQIYYIEQSYSTAYYFDITKLLYYRSLTKYLYISKETF